MKTALDMVDDVLSVIDITPVHNEITGVVIKHKRPASSKLIDLVVKALALTEVSLQEGICNINIHVPNLENMEFGGVADNEQPAEEKINQLCKLIQALVDGTNFADFNLNIDRPGMPVQEPDGSWFANIRVSYYSFNNNNKNI